MFNESCQLPHYFEPLIGDKKKVKIAEVAAGLVNTIGDTWPGVDVEVVCSDKNADNFNMMWEEKGIKPLHPITHEDVEKLSYEDNSFDIVHCRNALDHTRNPFTAIEEFKRVSKEWVILLHAPDQMIRYGGHHYWNVRLDGDKTVFYGRYGGFILNDFESHFDGELIVSIWRKK